MAKQPNPPLGVEQALKELEELVARMEQGELTLEESLECFERGIELTRACQRTIKEAEQKVEQLVRTEGRAKTVPCASEE